MNERDIFLSSLDIEDPAARKAHLQSACNGDAALLTRVESLLASHEGGSVFLNMPVVEQMGGEVPKELAPTLFMQSGSTLDKNGSTDAAFSLDSLILEQSRVEEEIPLGYLQPSERPDSLGRLAHYEILEVVGRGAFGTVLRAFDEKLQRVVAIKVMATELATTSPARKRFIREAQLSAAIRHEHVVSVYAVEEKPLPYLVMEYIPGATLQQRLDERGPLDISTVLRLGVQIAEGLAAAHAIILIHRDIKPGNILLEKGVLERVKITDFGLARAADDASMTQSGIIAGTPMYMAPEQALGQKIDQRVDLFSLGSVLYQMVSGRPPFRANSTLAVMKRVTEDTPRSIREIIPETPQWLCDIIAKLHAKNPDDRFQSAREVADVLADCEAQLKANAKLKDFSRIPKSKQPVAEKSGRLRWAAAAALLLPVLALAVTEIAGVTHLFQGGATGDLTKPGDEPTPIQVAKQESLPAGDWVPLFNGKDLTGWRPHSQAPGDWGVEDGVIVGRGDTSFLFNESKEYDNFHLRVEAKINTTGDSGILFRVPLDVRVNEGYEAQIAVRSNYPVHTGSLSSRVDPSSPLQRARLMPHRPDEWFVLEVIADGNHLQTRVNGLITADYREDKQAFVRGHIALQTWGRNITFVQFRKIEIKELPASYPSSPASSKRQFASDKWIDVIPLIDPQLDKWNIRSTGKNEWRIEQGELVAGDADDKPHKLLLPLDSDFRPSFDCELEVTRRKGNQGFNLNFPTANGDTPVTFDFPAQPGVFLRNVQTGIQSIAEGAQLETGKRTTLRVEVRRQQMGESVTVWNNGAEIGTWTGDRNKLASLNNEGYEHRRRLSLWIHGGGNEFVFHRIRVRMLDGGTAQTLRTVPSSSIPSVDAESLPAPFKNSIGMEFVIVPQGKSWLGGGKHKLGDKEVVIPADFYLGKFEVTQEEWEKVMGENPSFYSRNGGGMDAVKDIPEADLKRFPVETVSWDNCQLFVARLNSREKETGWVYRLPTAAEWEYACRGGAMKDKLESAFDFYFAKPTNTLLPEQANFKKGLNRPCKVGLYEANRLGLFDMHGNVLEWCDDTEKAKDGASQRVRQGGGWDHPSADCLAALRIAIPPSDVSYSLGLRLARVPSGTPSPEAKTPPLDVAPFTDADIQRIAALPAAEQVEEVRKELMRRNPGFDGKVTHKIEDGVVTEIKVVTDKVTDINPIRVFNALRVLDLSGSEGEGQVNGQLADLTPLKGMNLSSLTRLELLLTKIDDAGLAYLKDCKNLKYIGLKYTSVTDAGLAHFKNCKDLEGLDLGGLNVTDEGLANFKNCKGLNGLFLNGTRVTDVGLAHFKDCKNLTIFHVVGTQVTDAGLAYFKDCKKLTILYIEKTKITDLSLLKGMPLKELWCDFQPERDAEILRAIKTLQTINGKPAAEFWKDVEQK